MKYKQGLEAMYGISGETCTDLIPLKGQFIQLSTIFAIHHPQHSYSPHLCWEVDMRFPARMKFGAKLFLDDRIELGNRESSATFLKVRNDFNTNVEEQS